MWIQLSTLVTVLSSPVTTSLLFPNPNVLTKCTSLGSGYNSSPARQAMDGLLTSTMLRLRLLASHSSWVHPDTLRISVHLSRILQIKGPCPRASQIMGFFLRKNS